MSMMMEEPTTEYYSWHEQFYYFSLFRTLHGPEAAPSKENTSPIDEDTYYTHADLAEWIREQNASRKRFLAGQECQLSANQIKVLDLANFPWIRDSTERWDAHFKELMAFKAEHGHCNVPRRSADNGKLGIWVKNQRAAYHKLNDEANGILPPASDVKKTTAVITQDQIKLLTNIGFQWKIRADHSDVFDNYILQMSEFIKREGHCNPSPKEHPNLGRWVCEMRSRYKRRRKGEKTPLTDRHVERLDEIGFAWEKVRVVDEEERQRKKIEARKRKNEKRKQQRKEAREKKAEEAKLAMLNTLKNSEDAAGEGGDGGGPPKKKRKLSKKAAAAALAKEKAAALAHLKAAKKMKKNGNNDMSVPAIPPNPAALALKEDLTKKLASLKEKETERVKEALGKEDVRGKVEDIRNDIFEA